VIAAVTAYNDDDAVLKLIEALAAQTRPIDVLLVVDNSRTPTLQGRLAREAARVAHFEIEYHHFPENLGTAGATTFALDRARCRRGDLLWTFDQDSVPAPDALHHLEHYLVAERSRGARPIGIASCLPLLEPDGVPDHGQRFENFRFAHVAGSGSAPYDCDVVITSGAVVDLAATRGVPSPRLDFFIDSVDHEFCMKVRRAGLRVVVVPAARMIHRIGAARPARSMLRRRPIRLREYSPLRLYYITRNATFLETRLARFPWQLVAVPWRLRVMLRFVAGALHEPSDRAGKVLACVVGTTHGLAGRLGRAPAGDAPQRG